MSRESKKKVDIVKAPKTSDASEMSADEYLDMAYEAKTEEKVVEYAKKALQKDKNCLDAKRLIIEHSYDSEKAKVELEKAIAAEKTKLEEEGTFADDCIGHFYGIPETRPYMRACASYVELLISMGKIKKAMKECENLIHLNTNDNMGIRYRLMTLYAVLEDVKRAEALHRKYSDENSFMILYPKALLYYKMDNYKKIKTLIKKIAEENQDYVDFVTGELTLEKEDIDQISGKGMYSQGSIEEVVVCFEENAVLFMEMNHFNEWASKEYKQQK